MHIQPFLYIVYGASWIVWLASLRNPYSQSDAALASHSKKCAHVNPLLATFLYILAWVFLVSLCIALLCLPWLGTSNVHATSAAVTGAGGVLFIVLLISIFAFQIRYISDMRTSERTVAENCTPKHTYQRGIIYAFAIYMFVVGLGGAVLMGTTNVSRTDVATLIQKQ